MLSILTFCLSTTSDRAESSYCHKDTLLLIQTDPLPLCSSSSSQPSSHTPTRIQIRSPTFTPHILTTPVCRLIEHRKRRHYNSTRIRLAHHAKDTAERRPCWLLSQQLLRFVCSGIDIVRNWRAQSQHEAQHGDAEVGRGVIWSWQGVVLILCLCKLLNKEGHWFSTHPHPPLFSQEWKKERQKLT